MSNITYSRVNLADLQEVLAKLNVTLDGVNDDTANIACLAYAVLTQRPDLDVDKLVEVIKGASEYIALSVTDTEGVN